MEQLDEIVREFLVESHENLDQLDRDLLALESSPEDRKLISSVFRTIHTIKGTSGFLAFPKLEHVSHVGENLLVNLRDGQLQLNQEIASGLLSMVDAIRTILNSIEANAVEGDADFSELIARLEMLRDGKSASTKPTKSAPGQTEEVSAPAGSQTTPSSTDSAASSVLVTADPQVAAETVAQPLTVNAAATSGKKASRARKTKPAPQSVESNDADEMALCADPASLPCMQQQSASASATQQLGLLDELISGEQQSGHESTSAMPRAKSAVAKKPTPADANSDHPDGSSMVADSTVRIDVTLLDKLMNLVGELVLARNQILQFSQNSEDVTVSAASQRLNLITSELQEGVMKTRMQPIRNAWNKLPRVVRDLANACGKQVQLRMEGAETELDKTILEAIRDPLTHIVRNSVDHGIEAPDVRVKNGKSAEGVLCLRAFHEGGYVNIEIADDGGGIHLDRVRDKAIEKQLITAEQAARMNDRELTNLILLPGFSTAAKVTNVSGRGVGMDVVKTNVEKIGGSLDISTVAGQGTTLRIKIPLTLAIVPALIVRCQQDRYAIPQVNLLELVRLEAEVAHSGKVEVIHDAPVYRLRGKLLPLVYLDEQLGVRKRRTTAEYAERQTVNLAVLQAEDQQFGLVVDTVSDTQEIVVKPLGRHLQGVNLYAGATIMGDGALALILDLQGLATHAGLAQRHRMQSMTAHASEAQDASQQRSSWLVVDPGDGTRAAIPLAMVARLEEIPRRTIEQTGSREWVQYRGEIMPLLRVDGGHGYGGYGTEDSATNEMARVIVYSHGGKNVGLMVAKMLDIIGDKEPAQAVDHGDVRVIDGHITKILDLPRLVSGHIQDPLDAVAGTWS